MFVIAAPGQGSQKPGFLSPWLEEESARNLLGVWSDHIGVDLIRHGTQSDQETITDTAIAQPLIVAAGLMTGRALLAKLGDHTALRYAGHSVGEFTAAALAGVFSDEDALSLVALRGRAMAEASAEQATGMSAVIGGDLPEIEASLKDHGLFAANFNGGGQVVVAGLRSSLHAWGETPPQGTRVIPLSVAGAFHTPFMESAVHQLEEGAKQVPRENPRAPLYTNRDGSLVESGDTFVDYLIDQVARPVRWDSCMESFAHHGIAGMMELAPGGALTGLAKRGLKGVPTVAINTPEDVTVAREMVSSS
jgi:[acyl-carrier-protein] S-malonyltransferase